jgi:hypothetical protein
MKKGGLFSSPFQRFKGMVQYQFSSGEAFMVVTTAEACAGRRDHFN